MFKTSQAKFIGIVLAGGVIAAGVMFRLATSKLHLMLKDRQAAGEILADALADKLKNTKSTMRQEIVVVAVPRGGVVVGDIISRRLSAAFDIILGVKIGEPVSKEYAIGAVMEDGSMFLDSRKVKELMISAEYIENEILDAKEEIRRRNEMYHSSVLVDDKYKNKTVILVDDGSVTGATIIAAARSIRKQKPTRLIIALPIASSQNLRRIKAEADDLEVILTPRHSNFVTVGQFYQNFLPVSHRQVAELVGTRSQDPLRK